MGELVALVNRLRMKGHKYERIKEMLVKMGNTEQQASDAIDAYIKEIVG